MDPPSGPTYRVSGRPHPDGAVAFLVEDISAEVSLTRRFRSELELGQSLLDAVEDAIVVFSSAGVLTMSNTAYRDLWGIDPDSSFVDMTVLDSIRHWQSNCEATPILSEIRDYVLEYTERADWDAPVRTKTGIDLICRVHPVKG
jgi:PAS domain-containing protein